MTTRSPQPQAMRKSWWKIACACLAGATAAAGYAHAAAPTDSEIGFAAGLPQQVNLTDAWTSIQYQVAVQADRDVNGKLVVANLVVTRAGDQRNLASKPHLHGLQPDGFAAMDLAKGQGNSAFG